MTPAAAAQFILIALSFGALMWAFITSDFSLQLVVANSHSAKPMLYKISGTWGNHDAPEIVSFTAYDTASTEGLTDEDSFVIVFDQAVDSFRFDVATKEDEMALFELETAQFVNRFLQQSGSGNRRKRNQDSDDESADEDSDDVSEDVVEEEPEDDHRQARPQEVRPEGSQARGVQGSQDEVSAPMARAANDRVRQRLHRAPQSFKVEAWE